MLLSISSLLNVANLPVRWCFSFAIQIEEGQWWVAEGESSTGSEVSNDSFVDDGDDAETVVSEGHWFFDAFVTSESSNSSSEILSTDTSETVSEVSSVEDNEGYGSVSFGFHLSDFDSSQSAVEDTLDDIIVVISEDSDESQ